MLQPRTHVKRNQHLHVVASEVELKLNGILLLNDTPQLHLHRKDIMVVQFDLHEKLLLQSCRLYAVQSVDNATDVMRPWHSQTTASTKVTWF